MCNLIHPSHPPPPVTRGAGPIYGRGLQSQRSIILAGPWSEGLAARFYRMVRRGVASLRDDALNLGTVGVVKLFADPVQRDKDFICAA